MLIHFSYLFKVLWFPHGSRSMDPTNKKIVIHKVWETKVTKPQRWISPWRSDSLSRNYWDPVNKKWICQKMYWSQNPDSHGGRVDYNYQQASEYDPREHSQHVSWSVLKWWHNQPCRSGFANCQHLRSKQQNWIWPTILRIEQTNMGAS